MKKLFSAMIVGALLSAIVVGCEGSFANRYQTTPALDGIGLWRVDSRSGEVCLYSLRKEPVGVTRLGCKD